MALCVYLMPPCVGRPSSRSFWRTLRFLWASALMVLCVRKLDGKRDWEDPRKDEPWLGKNDLRADALRDLTTEGNKLSIYEVSEGVPIPRILAALAARRDNAVKLDFIVFALAVLDEIGIAYQRVSGDTHDDAVNTCHHCCPR